MKAKKMPMGKVLKEKKEREIREAQKCSDFTGDDWRVIDTKTTISCHRLRKSKENE